MSSPVIELKDLCLAFGDQSILSHFSLAVAKGETVILSGSSGSGKSTVLKCILGLVQPDSGSISINGQLVNGQSVWQLRHELAYVAQEADLDQQTVREAVEAPFNYKQNQNLKANLDRLPDLLKQFNLEPGILDKEMTQISGGEKQRVAIIISILLDRSIFLLDEITSALDERNSQLVIDYFKASDHTIIAIAHDKDWLSIADRVIDMDEGSVS
jgi:ABC-type iron transport system FetAB ATPase subunit